MMTSGGMMPRIPNDSFNSRGRLVLTAERPSVSNNGVSGSAINSTMLLRMTAYAPLGSFQLVGAGTSISFNVVIGRDCTMKNFLPSPFRSPAGVLREGAGGEVRHHSISC